jgi:tRNA(Phe) wybutosine-synthesizing methylase Tyw3
MRFLIKLRNEDEKIFRHELLSNFCSFQNIYTRKSVVGVVVVVHQKSIDFDDESVYTLITSTTRKIEMMMMMIAMKRETHLILAYSVKPPQLSSPRNQGCYGRNKSFFDQLSKD